MKPGKGRSGETEKRKEKTTRQEEAKSEGKLPSEIGSFLNLCFTPVK
jgi:hypothetical protein